MPAFVLVLASNADAADYEINLSESFSNNFSQQAINRYFTALYAPLGISPKLVVTPSRRGLDLVNNGEYEAEAMRFASVVNEYKNLIRVPTPVFKVSMYLYCVHAEHCELSKRDYIYIPKGAILTERFCQNSGISCHAVNTFLSALRAIERDKLGALIGAQQILEASVCSTGIEKLYKRAIPELSQSIYHYVHVSQQHLLPALNKNIQIRNAARVKNTIKPYWADRPESCKVKITELFD